MGQFKDAIDKQFPPKTDEDRTAYYAARRRNDVGTPRLALILLAALVCAAPFLYMASANATPFLAPLSAAASVAQRNNQPKPAPEIWKDGPCKGQIRGQCSWFVNGVKHQ